jgi:hypothetical protein
VEARKAIALVRAVAAGGVRRLHGRRGRWRLGADRHARAAELGADGAAHGRRVGRHRRAFVSLGASLGFLFSLGSERIEFAWVAALLDGGVLAAPLAAWLVRKLPARILGSAVGSVILVTNAKTIVEAAGLAETAAVVAYVAIVGVSLFLVARAIVLLRRDAQAAGATA